MNKQNIFSVIFLSSFFLIVFFCPVQASSELSNEDWKKILAIREDKDNLTGANLILTIEPEQYYHEMGSEVVLSGSLKGLFGPLFNSTVAIERINATNSTQVLQTKTDNQGIYSISDTLSEKGSVTYQAKINSDDRADSDPLKSKKFEVYASHLENRELTSDIHRDILPNRSAELSLEYPENISVILNTNSTFFIPGEIIYFTGNLSRNEEPIPYAQLRLIPEIRGEQVIQGIPIERQTKIDGTVQFSFHLTDPDPVIFILEYPQKINGPVYSSEQVTLNPIQQGVNPPPRIIYEKESIDIYLKNESAESLQNITIYGWHNGKGGNDQPLSTLELVWYNFGEKIWDSYQNSSQILTNADGKIECIIQAPQTTGTYLIAIKKPGNVTRSQIYSNILALTVTSPEYSNKPLPETRETARLFIEGYPSPVQVSEPLVISMQLENTDSITISNSTLLLYYSDNGLEWNLFQTENSALNSYGMANVELKPDKPGYWYFRASLGNNLGPIINSNVLVIPVIMGNPDQ